MGLDIVVGVLMDDDEDFADRLAAEFEWLNGALAAVGLPSHDEPEVIPGGPQFWDMPGYSGLPLVRRIAAQIAAGRVPTPAENEDAADDDPDLNAYYAVLDQQEPPPAATAAFLRTGAEHCFDHLILHSDADGWYVPVPMDAVLAARHQHRGDDLIGSSQMLLEECGRLASAIGLPPGIDPNSQALADALDAFDAGAVATGWRRFPVESLSLACLQHAARVSVATGAAISFS